MATEELIDRHIKTFNDHDAAGWASHYAENAVVHDPQYPQPLKGREAIRKDLADFLKAFPDLQFKVTNRLVSGDRAAVEGIGTGTHRGPLEGPGGSIPATNKRAEMPFAVFLRVDGSGLIVEERRYYDLAGLAQQLGVG